MWIMMNDAFISVVEDEVNKNMFSVRARIKGDLENVFGDKHEVLVDVGTDYKFRMYLDKEYVNRVISERISNINYGNFKNSISKKDHQRKRAYSDVWSVMFNWQTRLYGQVNDWWTSYRSYK